MKRVLLFILVLGQFIFGQEILQRNNASGITYSLTTQYTAVRFTANENYTVGAIEIQVKYNKLIFNSNQWIYGNIYDDNGNKPGKQIIQGISSKVTAIPSVFGQVNLLTNAILNKNTVYWLVIRLDYTSPDNSLICNSDTLGGGAISHDGITWTVNKVQLNVIIKGRPYNPPVQGNTEASLATKIISLSGDMTKDNPNNVLRLKRDLYGPYIASGDLLYLQDNSRTAVTGAAFAAEIDSIIRIKLNPRAQGNETAYKLDTKEDIAGNLLEIAKKGTTKIKVDSSGTIEAGGFTVKGKNILDSIKSTNDSLTAKFNEADTLNTQKFSMIADSLARNSLDIQINKQLALDSLYNHIILINAQYDSLKSHNLRLLTLIDSLKNKVNVTDTSGRWQPRGVYSIPADTLLSLAYLKALLNYKLPSGDTTNIRAYSDAKYLGALGTVPTGAIPYLNSTSGKSMGASGMYWDAVNGKLQLYDNAATPVVRFSADPNVSDGSSAVAYNFDTKNTLATAGAKLLSIKNGGTEKVYVDYNGAILSRGGITAVGSVTTNSDIYVYSGYKFLNKTGTNWLSFATRITTGTEAVYDLSNVGSISASSIVMAAQFSLSALNTAPASATATGTVGEIRIVDGFIYVCVSANSWKRAALSSW